MNSKRHESTEPDVEVESSLLASVLAESSKEIIDVLHTDDFYSVLVAKINRLAATDSSVVLLFAPNEPPAVLYAALHPSEVISFQNIYMAGAYMLSPLYQNWSELKTGFYRTKDLCDAGLSNSEFSKYFFVESGLSDEGNFLVRLQDDRAIALCFGRQKIPSVFNASELYYLHIAEPIISSAIAKQQEYSSKLANSSMLQVDPQQVHARTQTALDNFGRDVLTEREHEVMQQMLKGRSSKMAARVLDISPDTIRSHRKRIYTKMGVGSQSELMSKLLDSLVNLS